MPPGLVEIAEEIGQSICEKPLDLGDGQTGALGDLGIAMIVEANGEEYLALSARHAPHRILHLGQQNRIDAIGSRTVTGCERALERARAAGGHCPSSMSCWNCRRKSAALLAALAARKIAFSSLRNTASQLPI